MIVLGINPGSHDSAACVVRDGLVIAAVEEERFTRRKHALDEMPWNASLYCLAQAGISLEDVDYIAICWAGPDQPENSIRFYDEAHVLRHEGYYRRKLFPKSYFGDGRLPSMAHVSHHLAHAACAYRCSPFDDAAVLVVDGQGESVSTSIAYGHGGQIQFITQFGVKDSLGYFYQAVSEYLGFGWIGGEGKTMGLAAYGEACFNFPEFSLLHDGYSATVPEPGSENPTRAMLKFWQSRLEDRFGQRRVMARVYDPVLGRCRNTQEFSNLEKNVAASAQSQLEQVLLHLAELALRCTTSKNLALSGGVALNCSANGKVAQALRAEPFIFPAAGDAGAAIGAALEVSAELGIQAERAFRSPFLGPDFAVDAIEKTLKNSQVSYSICADPAAKAAELIATGCSVGWFQGRTELGPRALGHRSILADPRSPAIRDHVNASIKHREYWRPFAPSIAKEEAGELLGADVDSPYMLLAVPVPDAQQQRIRGTVHVDGTTRPQTVVKAEDPLYHAVIERYCQITGVPAVLNTSFNDEAEPIVCAPRDAIRTFWSTGLDYLLIGPFIVGPKSC